MIRVVFKINKKGEIVDVRARASHPALQNEAIRVVSLIPKFDAPGMQNGKPVVVPYSLPNLFQVEENNRKLNESKQYNISGSRTKNHYDIDKQFSKRMNSK